MLVAGLVATAVCGLAVVALVLAERTGSQRTRFISKPIASAAFVAIPLVTGGLGTGAGPVAVWVTVGLGLGAIGDVALMFDRRGFLPGLVAFLLGHVAYVIAFGYVLAPDTWLSGAMAIYAIAPAFAAVVVLRWLWPHLGSLRIPVIAYIAVITAMVIGGLAVSVHHAGTSGYRTFLTAGAIAFYLSDLAVARNRFVVADRWNRYLGLPVYYGAQLLMAWAISPR